MRYAHIFILILLASGQIIAQATTAPPVSVLPAFQILSESTVQQRDGSSITFRQVVPPLIAPQVQPAAPVPAPVLSAAEEEALSQMQVKEAKMLSISASVHANGLTVLRWTCGTSQRMQAVSNVDFRYLAGLGNLETEQASYFIILSAGLTDEAMKEDETRAAQSLPVNGSASAVLLQNSSAANKADEFAVDAMESLLDYFDTHREELVQLYTQREAEKAARDLAALGAPPPPPRHSIVHFWPLQPAQREAIQAKTQQETQRVTNGGRQ